MTPLLLNAARAFAMVGFADGKLVGTNRLYEDGVFTRHGREDGKALFCMGDDRVDSIHPILKEQV